MWLTVLLVVISYVVAEGSVIFAMINSFKIAFSTRSDTAAAVVMSVVGGLCAISAVVMPLYWVGVITWETIK